MPCGANWSTSDELVVRVDARDGEVGRSIRITIGEPNQMAELLQLEPRALVAFDEWRGWQWVEPSERAPHHRGARRPGVGPGREPIDVEKARGKATAIVTLPCLDNCWAFIRNLYTVS